MEFARANVDRPQNSTTEVTLIKEGLWTDAVFMTWITQMLML